MRAGDGDLLFGELLAADLLFFFCCCCSASIEVGGIASVEGSGVAVADRCGSCGSTTIGRFGRDLRSLSFVTPPTSVTQPLTAEPRWRGAGRQNEQEGAPRQTHG